MIEATIIRISGGFPGEETHATIDGATIARHPGETVDEFEARVMNSARPGQVVVIGGFPDGD